MRNFLFAFLCIFAISIQYSECDRNCKNGGVKVTLKGVEYCICHKDFAGIECEIKLSTLSVSEKKKFGCALKPCWFGSTCEDLTHIGGTFKCHCSANTYGDLCEKSGIDGTNPCKTMPCYNNGDCINQDDVSYRCNCVDPYGDSNCKTNTLGPCKNLPCRNDAICIGNLTNYKCNCMDWTIGENCEQVINPCDYVSCGLAGSCIKRRTLSYECKCQEGYVGLRCEQPIQETCLSGGNRCVRGECLINETGHYSCRCPTTGYGGKSCEIEKCNPLCSNGVCRENSYGYFSCDCSSGYKGASCSDKTCFSGDMEVEVQGYGFRPISKLMHGNMVKTLDTDTMAPVYTKVLTYLHRDDNVEADYFLIKTRLKKALKLSAKHLIAKKKCKQPKN